MTTPTPDLTALADKLDELALEKAEAAGLNAFRKQGSQRDALRTAITAYLQALPQITTALREAARMREVEAERDRMAAELEKMREETANLLFSASSTFKARNGRDVGIEADDGEKCWIVHDDLLQPFRNFVERAALKEESRG